MSKILKSMVILIIFFTISCSPAYEKLSKSSHNLEDGLSKYLYNDYKKKAKFEFIEMYDIPSAELYSKKALLAKEGKKILPERIGYWKIPIEKKLDLIKSYNNLITVYDEAKNVDPLNLSKAIISLDCWSEQQEEKWQTWDINKCREDFFIAMHNIYDLISDEKLENKNNNRSILITKNIDKINFKIIYFDFNKDKLSLTSIKEIKKFINLNTNTYKKIIIVGHTDTMGSNLYNSNLSINRANAIKHILLKEGIKSVNIKVSGMGEKDLRVKTTDEVAHPANRRAEISLIN